MKTKDSLANMGFLILEAWDHDWVEEKQNRFMWWTREGPVGFVYVDFEVENEKYDAWKLEEQRKTTSKLGAAGGGMTDFDQLAKQILERIGNTPELANIAKLELKDFNGIAAIMHEAGEMTVGDSDAKTAAWWAWRKYQAHGLTSKHAEPTPQTQLEPLTLMANGGNPEASKYSDEGFEENELQDLPEFRNLWLDELYFIPQRRTELGDATDHPDVIGMLKDGSIDLLNAKCYAWRPGDSIYVGGKRGQQRKINAELVWYDKLQDRGFTERIRIIVFVKHKQTRQVFIKEAAAEKAKPGSLRIKLPDPTYPPPPPPLPTPPTSMSTPTPFQPTHPKEDTIQPPRRTDPEAEPGSTEPVNARPGLPESGGEQPEGEEGSAGPQSGSQNHSHEGSGEPGLGPHPQGETRNVEHGLDRRAEPSTAGCGAGDAGRRGRLEWVRRGL